MSCHQRDPIRDYKDSGLGLLGSGWSVETEAAGKRHRPLSAGDRTVSECRPSRFIRDTVAKSVTRLTAKRNLKLWFVSVSTLLLTSIASINCSQILSGREYTIGGRVGEDVVLPCDVNVTSCGRVYFITWTKNTSTEWKRVYLYSDSYETPMGQLMDPEKASFYLEKNAAYLRIKSLSVEDEGAYKCDVTYVHGKCPSLSFVQLHAFIVPSEPIIEVESVAALNGSEVGPFVEGSPLAIACKSHGGRPPPHVAWFNGTRPMVSKTRMKADPAGTFDVISTVRFVLTRWDLGAKLYCKVFTNATKTPQEKWIKLDVHVRPHSLLVRSPQAHVVAGEMVSLTCTVNGARPAANITWYNRSDIVRPQPPSSKDLMSEGTYRTSSTLVFTALRYDHQGEFFCKGTNEVLKKRQEAPLLTAAKLHVLYPPAVAVSPEGKLSIPEHGAANISCTFDANPPNVTDILWYKDGKIHKTRRKADSKTRRPLATVLRLRNVSREDAGSYSCEARNAFGRDNSSNALLLDVMHVPIVNLKLDRSTIIEGSKTNITMECEVLQGNPIGLKTVRWYQNDSLIRETESDNLVLTAVNRSFSSTYFCEGQNEAGWGERSEPKAVLIQYPPGPAIIRQLEAEAVKGKSATLRCLVEDAGFPYPSHFRWEHFGAPLANSSFESLAIDPVTVSSQGNYTCSAVNDVGGGAKGFFFLTAKAPPNFVVALPEHGGALRNTTSVSLSCRVECEPPCDVQWYRNNESLAESKAFSSSGQLVTEDPEANLFRSVMSTLTWSMALLRTESFHNSVFTCKSTGNGVGPGVSSSTLFTIEYPPEDVQLSAVKIELVEGEMVEDLRCSASANPGGDFHWLLGERLVHSGPVLSFNSSVSREMGGRYTCVVSNRHGRAQADVDVTVLHRPECYLWRDFDQKGNVMLTCSAKGNPGVSRFVWYRNNSVLQEVVAVSYSTEGSSSTYSLPADTPDMYGKYACVAVNAIGNSDSCELELAPLPSPAGWVQLFLQEENLIIVACVAGGIAVLGIILVTVIIILVIRRRFSGPPKSEVDDHEKSPQFGSRRHLEPNLFSPESETEREPFARRICDFHNDLGHHNHLEEPDMLKKQIYPENGVG